MGEYWNWAGTFRCRPRLFFEPSTVDELRSILNEVNQKQFRVRTMGCAHSPSALAMSNEVLISMKKFNNVIEIAPEKMEIDVESGVLFSTLNELLPQFGLSLPIQASSNSITVGGAISTATHGSGFQYGTLSSYVQLIRLMQLNGKENEFTEEQDKELFRCLTCSLGSFGVITSVRLKVVPQFDLELNRYYLSYNSFLETFKTHYSSSDHFYYLWYPHTNGGIANHLTRVSPRKISPKKSIFSRFTSWIRSSLIDHYLLEFLFFVSLWIPRLVIYINRFYLRLDRRSYHEIARCDRLLNFDTVIRQYATEWAVPLDEAVSCLTQLHQWIDKHYSRTPVHYPIVVRFSCSENSSYLSPGFERATCWINVASTRSYGISHSQHRPLFEALETIFQQHKGRPHWAKEHPLTGKNLRQVYPQWDLFHEKRQQFDPNNLFVNDYLKKIFIDD